MEKFKNDELINSCMKQLHIRIHGRVQGVFFRDFACKRADMYGVCGIAKNMPDGSLDIIVQGDDEAVDEFLQDMREGPAGAKVEKIDIDDMDVEDEFDDFQRI